MAWNGSDGEKAKARGEGEQRREKHPSVRLSSSPSPKFNYKALVAGLTVVAGGAIVAYMILWNPKAAEPKSDGKPPKAAKIAEVSPHIANTNVVAAPVAPEAKEDKNRPAREQPVTHGRLPPKKYIPTIAEIEAARLGPDGKPRKKSIYKTPLEQSLGIIFTTKLGSRPPMLPGIPRISSEDQLLKFFKTSFEVDENASEAVRENREMMNQVKKELEAYLAGGGSPEGFIDHYMGELQSCHDQWKSAENILLEMNRDGESVENILAYREKANAILAEKGIKPLVLPPALKAAAGENVNGQQ